MQEGGGARSDGGRDVSRDGKGGARARCAIIAAANSAPGCKIIVIPDGSVKRTSANVTTDGCVEP